MKVSQIFDCPPAGINAAAPVVAHGAKAGQRAGIPQRLSNLDRDGHLVKKGLTVSLFGLRYLVVKVRAGYFIGREISPWGVPRLDLWSNLRCDSVRVVV